MPPRIGRFANEASSSQRPGGGRSRSRPSPDEDQEAKRLKEEEELSASRLGYKSLEVETKDYATAFSALTLIGPGWVSIPAQGELLVLAPQRTILELKVDVESADQVLLLIPEGDSPHVWLIGANYFATQAKDLLHGVDLHAAKHFSSLVFYRSQNGEVYTRPLKLAPVEEFKQYLHQDAQKRKVAVLKQKSNAVENQIRKIVDEEVRRSQELALRIQEIDHALREMATHTDLVASRDFKIVQDDMHSLHNQLDQDIETAFQQPSPTPQQQQQAGLGRHGPQYSPAPPSATAGTLFDTGNVRAASHPDSDSNSDDNSNDESPVIAAPTPTQPQSFAQLLEQQEKTLQRQRSLLQKMLEKANPPRDPTPKPQTPKEVASVASTSRAAPPQAPIIPLSLPGLGDPTVSTPEATFRRGRPVQSLSTSLVRPTLANQPGFVMTASKNSSRITSSNSPRQIVRSPTSVKPANVHSP